MNEQQYTRSSDRILNEHMVSEENRLTRIENRLENLEEDLKKLTTSVEDLVAAWKTAGHIVSFVKWLASGLVALTALILAFKTGLFK